MSFDDFVENWDKLGVCHLTPSTLRDEIFKPNINDANWKTAMYSSSWIVGVSAGGSKGDKYWTNPQFLVDISHPAKSDEDKSTLIVALMQKDSKTKPGKLHIQFRLFKVIFKRIFNYLFKTNHFY